MSDAIITLATVPAILATVNLAKQFGVKGRWAALVAVALGVLFQELDYITLYMADWGQIDPRQLLMQAGEGFLLGLGAAGLYDLTPSPATPASKPESEPSEENWATLDEFLNGLNKAQADPAGVLAPLIDEPKHGKHEA